MTMVIPSVLFILFNSFKILFVVSGSNALVASSQSKTSGSLASARAIPTLCFCPPLKLEAKISDLSLNPTRSSSSLIRFGTCFLSYFDAFKTNSMLS